MLKYIELVHVKLSITNSVKIPYSRDITRIAQMTKDDHYSIFRYKSKSLKTVIL